MRMNTPLYDRKLEGSPLVIEPQPKVCVVIAAYNSSATILRAVESALEQTADTEVIVVDDASSDDTVSLVSALSGFGERLKVIGLKSNVGPAAARNRALELTSADFVTPLDADDYMAPDRIEKLLAQVGDADFIADDLDRRIENQDEVRPCNLIEPDWPSTRPMSLVYFIDRNISRSGAHRQELGFLKPLIRRSFLLKHDLRYEENLRLGEDYALYVTALARGAKFLLVPGCGYVAVQRANSLSSQHSKTDLQRLQDFDEWLLGAVRLSPAEKRIVRRHSQSIRLKVDYRHILEDKGAGRYFDVAARLLFRPSTAFYVLNQTRLAKSRRATNGVS